MGDKKYIKRSGEIAILYSGDDKELLEINSSYSDKQIEEIFKIANQFYFEGYMMGKMEKVSQFKDFFDKEFAKFGKETIKHVSKRKP